MAEFGHEQLQNVGVDNRMYRNDRRKILTLSMDYGKSNPGILKSDIVSGSGTTIPSGWGRFPGVGAP